MDEFDIEVTPLESPSPEEDSIASPAPVGQQSPLARSLSQRGRWLRVGSMLAVILIAMTLLITFTPGVRSVLAGIVSGPTPTATPSLAGGKDRFTVEHTVPWGVLMIDGRQIPSQTLVGSSTGTGLPFRLSTFGLSRGQHRVEYRATLFPTLSCTVSVPAALSDTCPLEPNAIDFFVSDGPSTRMLDLRATPDRLPAEQVQALADVTQVALDAEAHRTQGQLAPGDHYLDTNGTVVTARTGLIAVPTYTLSRDLDQTSGAPCAILCAELGPLAPTSAEEWLVNAPATLTWSYRDVNGHSVLDGGLPMPSTLQQPASVDLGVRFGNNRWQVRIVSSEESGHAVSDVFPCALGAHYLDVLRASPEQTTVSVADFSYQWPISAASPQLGCVLVGGRISMQGSLLAPIAEVLYRFGVLLAVNDAARQVFPHLPLANAHERALALRAWSPSTDTSTP